MREFTQELLDDSNFKKVYSTLLQVELEKAINEFHEDLLMMKVACITGNLLQTKC